MALITCPECGKQFSEFADKCPNCGCPTDKIKELQKPAEEPKADNEVQKAAEPASPVVAAEHKVAKIITIAVVAGLVIALFVIIGIEISYLRSQVTLTMLGMREKQKHILHQACCFIILRPMTIIIDC